MPRSTWLAVRACWAYNAAFDATQTLKSESYQISSANGAVTRMKSIDPVTSKISWTEQSKDVTVALRANLVTGSTAFTTDDEVYHVLTYNAAFDATQT